MFTHLMASRPPHFGLVRPGTVSVSMIAHAVLLTAVVYASVAAPPAEVRTQEQVSFVEIEEQKAPEQPKAEEPPPPPVARAEAAPPVPRGFQELVPPEEPPAAIPDVDVSAPAVSAADFSGIGVAGGRADGDPAVKEAPKEEPPRESQPGYAYEVAVLDAPPQLRNPEQIVRQMERLYPTILLDAQIEGTVVVEFVITEKGVIDPATVKVVSATHELFSAVTVEAAEKMRFVPGRYKGKSVRVLTRMPIVWKPVTR